MGNALAVAGWLRDAKKDGTAVLWDLAEGRPRSLLSGHTSLIMGMSLSPDGRLLATASTDTTARLWDMSRLPAAPTPATADPNARPGGSQGGSAMLVERRLKAAPDPVDAVMLALAYSPDGRTLAMAGEDKTITLRDAATGAVLRTLAGHTDIVAGLAFSPDGNSVASASYDKTVRIWDVADGREKAVLQGHKNWVLAVAYASDGKSLATAGYDKLVKLWDVAEAKEIASFAGHSASVRAVAFAPDGKTVASGGGDRVVKLWDVAGRTERATLKGHKKTIRALAYSPDGALLASASEDGTIKLWDPAGGNERATLEGHADMVTCVAFAGAGGRLLSGCWDGTIKLWDTGTGKEQASIVAHPEAIAALAVAPDGRQFATSGQEKVWKLWSVTSNQRLAPRATIAADQPQIRTIAYSPDGSKLVVAGGDFAKANPATSVARVWDPGSGKPLVLLRGHSRGISSAVFSPDGTTIATGSWDATIRLWNAATGAEVSRLAPGSVTYLTFTPDGTALVSAGQDRALRVWDVASGEPRSELEGGSARMQCVAFAPGGKLLVTGGGPFDDKPGSFGELRLWTMGDTLTEAARLEGHSRSVLAAVFTPDGKSLVTGSVDRSLRVWDVASRQVRVAIEGLPNWVEGLAVSPDGRWIASAGKGSNDVLLHDLNTGEQQFRLGGHLALVRALAFSPDGKTLATGGDDGTLRFWDVPAPASSADKK